MNHSNALDVGQKNAFYLPETKKGKYGMNRISLNKNYEDIKKRDIVPP